MLGGALNDVAIRPSVRLSHASKEKETVRFRHTL